MASDKSVQASEARVETADAVDRLERHLVGMFDTIQSIKADLAARKRRAG